MAEFIGKDGIHRIEGDCDLCGTPCDPCAEELNCLSCTFQHCEAGIYHQDCLEKFLRRVGCEKNRKTGFQCPRGKGKSGGESCPGRIDKSHPIHPRKEEKKKVKATPEVAQPVKKYGPAAKEARRKEKEERDRQKAERHAAEEELRKQAAKQQAAAAKKAKSTAADPQRTKAIVESIRREMGGGPVATSDAAPQPAASTGPSFLTLDDYEASRSASSFDRTASGRAAAPSLNAWAAKPPIAEQERPSIASEDAFPAMPGAKGERSMRERQLSTAAAQRTFKASLAGPPEPPPPNPTANYTTLQMWQAHPPPPPPPRTDSSMGREGSNASLMHSQAPPGIRTHPSASVRMSQQSSLDSPRSNSSMTSFQASSYQTAPTVEGTVCGSMGSLPVGALYEDTVSSNGEQKLTKAQKKNLKRAERKARQTADDVEPSNASADNARLLQQCMVSIAHFKAMSFLQGLMAMGFDRWLCLAAIRRAGIDGNAATGWILDQQSESFSGGKQSWLEEATEHDGPRMQVDVSPEVSVVERVCAALPAGGITAADVYAAVIDTQGNVQQALLHVLEQAQQHQEVGSWSEGHVGTASALSVLNDS